MEGSISPLISDRTLKNMNATKPIVVNEAINLNVEPMVEACAGGGRAGRVRLI